MKAACFEVDTDDGCERDGCFAGGRVECADEVFDIHDNWQEMVGLVGAADVEGGEPGIKEVW